MQDDIDRFVDYFQTNLVELRALQSPHAELYRKVMYVGILDTLSGVVMPHRTGSRERFVYFLQRFCRWPDGDKVSLPHLMQLLRKNPDPAFEKLRAWVLTRYKAMPAFSGQVQSIENDPSCEEVRRMWPAPKEHRTPLEGVDLESLQHWQLMYAYRNSLIHALRTPGYGMEFGSDESPHYHQMSTPATEDREVTVTAELVYPWKFLHKLCDTGLIELRKYFLENEINPFDSYVFGSYWLSELNR